VNITLGLPFELWCCRRKGGLGCWWSVQMLSTT